MGRARAPRGRPRPRDPRDQVRPRPGGASPAPRSSRSRAEEIGARDRGLAQAYGREPKELAKSSGPKRPGRDTGRGYHPSESARPAGRTCRYRTGRPARRTPTTDGRVDRSSAPRTRTPSHRSGRRAHGRRHEGLPRSRRRRADQPRRAFVRHLLAPAEGTHRLPGHADRRQRRQPDHGAAPAPRVGGSRQGHPPVHQLAGRRHHGAVRDLRHDAVHQARRVDDRDGPGGLGRRGAAARRARRASGSRFRTRACCCTSRTAARRARRSTSRSRPRRSSGTASCSSSSSPSTRASRSRRSRRTRTATTSSRPTRRSEYGVVDEIITTREDAAGACGRGGGRVVGSVVRGRAGRPAARSGGRGDGEVRRLGPAEVLLLREVARSRSRSSSPVPASTSATSASTSATRSSRRSSPRPPSSSSRSSRSRRRSTRSSTSTSSARRPRRRSCRSRSTTTTSGSRSARRTTRSSSRSRTS